MRLVPPGPANIAHRFNGGLPVAKFPSPEGRKNPGITNLFRPGRAGSRERGRLVRSEFPRGPRGLSPLHCVEPRRSEILGRPE